MEHQHHDGTPRGRSTKNQPSQEGTTSLDSLNSDISSALTLPDPQRSQGAFGSFPVESKPRSLRPQEAVPSVHWRAELDLLDGLVRGDHARPPRGEGF